MLRGLLPLCIVKCGLASESMPQGAVLLDAAMQPRTVWEFEAVMVLLSGHWPPRGLLSGVFLPERSRPLSGSCQSALECAGKASVVPQPSCSCGPDLLLLSHFCMLLLRRQYQKTHIHQLHAAQASGRRIRRMGATRGPAAVTATPDGAPAAAPTPRAA